MLDGGMDRKNALRLRLTTEEIMLNWQQQLGEDALCRIVAGKKMGRATLRLQAHGAQFNPLQSETGDGDSYQKSILSGLGMAPIYRYSNGVNRVLLRIPRKGLSTPAGILIAIALALISGLALGRLPADTISFLDTGILQPLMNAFMRALSTVAGPLIFLSVLTGICSIGNRENLGKMGGRLVPTFIIAITTASSAAAFATNSESCEKQLGISRKLTSFGLPLGQVLYKSGVVITYMLVVLFTAEKYRLAITPGWILIAMLLCTALTVATPPVSGGGLTSYTILFTQLILPLEYLPVILSLNMVMDFIGTSVNLFCLQNQLILIADKSGGLKREILKA